MAVIVIVMNPFVSEIIELGQHYDGRIQHAAHKGNTIRFSGFNVIKARAVEDVAQEHGKRVEYMLDSNSGPWFRACDDVDGAEIQPVPVTAYIATKKIASTVSQTGGATQRYDFEIDCIRSEDVRNLLSHPQTLDVWIYHNRITVIAISPSQIIGGLSERAVLGTIRRNKRWTRPTFCGKSRHSKWKWLF